MTFESKLFTRLVSAGSVLAVAMLGVFFATPIEKARADGSPGLETEFPHFMYSYPQYEGFVEANNGIHNTENSWDTYILHIKDNNKAICAGGEQKFSASDLLFSVAIKDHNTGEEVVKLTSSDKTNVDSSSPYYKKSYMTLTNDELKGKGSYGTDSRVANDAGLTIFCQGGTSGSASQAELRLNNIPAKYFEIDKAYDLEFLKKADATEDFQVVGEIKDVSAIATGYKNFSTMQPTNLTPILNGDVVQMFANNSIYYALPFLTDFSNLTAYNPSSFKSLNPSVAELHVGDVSNGEVGIVSHHPGTAIITNGKGKTDPDYKQFTVVVKKQYVVPTAETVERLKKVVSLTNPKPFSQDAQFYQAIKFLFEQGITTGAEDKDGNIHYYGDNSLTRGQFATFLYRFSGFPEFTPTDEDNFSDTSNHQFAKEIAWLKVNKISTGDNGAFHPDLPIKRGEMAKFIALTFADGDEIEAAKSFTTFCDLDENNEFTKYIKLLGAKAISTGDKSGYEGSPLARYYPDAEISRGQVAQFLKNTFDKLLVVS
ncbi:MAG: S-layer homology domain-containing protein [Candidatus Ancillula sp.]|jgi:hypothetical protein|nr:S-layer homology domain-containing protein [Candidatus Ancillula sp.]